jgi:hypothetical protein
MKEIPLTAIANQTLSIRLDDRLYDITIKELNNAMGVTIVRDGITIVTNALAVAGAPLIPYRYLEDGNFIIITLDDEIPYYTQFGITQSLIYASQSELEAIRGI